MRTCSACKVEKPLDDFHRDPHSALGRGYKCKPCKRAYVSALQKANPERTRTKNRKSELRKLYGMSVEQYDDMLAAQQGQCAICGSRPSEDRRLCVDHCHVTGKVRGLLCDRCNRGLGAFRDDTDSLARAITYLRQ